MKKVISKILNWRERPGAFEKPSQDKPVIPANFKIPESLEAQVARIVRSQISQKTVRQRAQELDPDFEDLDRDLRRMESPHELVNDPDVGEVTRWEKEELDKAREAFDARAKALIERARERKRAAKLQPEVKVEKEKPVSKEKPD